MKSVLSNNKLRMFLKPEAGAVILTVIGLWMRFFTYAKRDFWIDEQLVLSNALGPFQPFWQRLNYGELICFPGQFLMTWPIAQIFGTNKWGLVIPQLISTLFCFYFLYLICRKHLATAWGTGIAFTIVAFNSQLMFHSFEFRWYAVLQTLGLVVFFYSEQVICHIQNLTQKKKFLIGLLFVLIVGYHTYGIVMIFFAMLYFALIEISRKSIKVLFAELYPFLVPFLLIAIPLFAWYASGFKEFNSAMGLGRSINVFHFIPSPVKNPAGFLKGIFGNLIGCRYLYVFLPGFILSFAIKHPDRGKQIGFFLVMVVLPIELMLIGSVYKHYWFLQRSFVWIMPLFAFYLAWCWESVFFWIKERIAVWNDRK